MDDKSPKDETKHPICSHCQKPYQGRCHCRPDSPPFAREPSPAPAVDRPITADGRPDSSPPPPSDRGSQLAVPDSGPPRRPEPAIIEPDQEADSANQPESAEEMSLPEPEEPEITADAPDPADQTETAAAPPSDSAPPAASPAQPAPSRAKPDRPAPVRQSGWGWLLVFGPLSVAIGIILWFQFRVLPSPGGGANSTVDFPPVDRPAAPETPPAETIPPDPPAPEEPAGPDPDPEETDPLVDPGQEPEPEDPPEPVPIDPALLRQFDHQAFVNLFDSAGQLPNLTGWAGQPAITGDAEADSRLRTLAGQAGYLIQPVPADTSQLIGVHQLQPLAAEAWAGLSRAAEAAGQPLTITLGYLSPADQARLLAGALGGQTDDESLQAGFGQVMVPGYSRHQTGFVIDVVASNQPGVRFQQTAGYDWLAADNFAAAKHFGFVPSRPDNSPHGASEHLVAFELAFVGQTRLLVDPSRPPAGTAGDQAAENNPG